MKPIFTDDKLKEICENEGYTFIKTFKKQKSNSTLFIRYMEITHNLCGKTYSCRVDKFIGAGQRCTCLRKKKYASIKNTDDYNLKLKSLYGDEYICVSTYLGSHKPVKIKHSCGYEYLVPRSEMMILQETKCPICNNNKVRTKEETELRLKKIGLNCNILNDNFIDEKSKHRLINVDIINKKCMHKYNINITDVLLNRNRTSLLCPICFPSTTGKSSYETELSEEIKKFYSGKLINNYRDGKLELDVFIPDFNIGLEIDGLYWHSSAKKDSQYHINKTNYFAEKGIRVIHIYEDEWVFKKDIVLDKIKSLLSVEPNKIYARKCKFIKIENPSIKNDFLNRYHIQGEDKSDLKYGLQYNNELVAIMTMKKFKSRGHCNDIYGEGAYELTRFATINNTTVIGAFSKLLSNIIKENKQIKKIISFGDLRIVDPKNNVYINNGFYLDHITQPSYYYVKGLDRLSKYSFRKSSLKKYKEYDDNLTEEENMLKLGYYRIYDCGLLAYIKDINNE